MLLYANCAGLIVGLVVVDVLERDPGYKHNKTPSQCQQQTLLHA